MKTSATIPGIGALLASALLLACGSNEEARDRTATGPLMRSGENCLSCHRAGGQAARRPWTAAGTVYASADAPIDQGVEGATITLVGNDGKRVSLVSNAAGNFFTAEPLQKPLRMTIEFGGRRREMPIPLDAEGACNACHSHPDPIGGAAGRIRLP